VKELYPWRKAVKIPLPAAVKPQLIRHLSVGLLYPVTDELKEARERAGLSPVPPTAHGFKDAVEEIRKVVKAIGVDRNVGLDMDRMEYKFK
jgi:heterodisulfide reductase subunit C